MTWKLNVKVVASFQFDGSQTLKICLHILPLEEFGAPPPTLKINHSPCAECLPPSLSTQQPPVWVCQHSGQNGQKRPFHTSAAVVPPLLALAPPRRPLSTALSPSVMNSGRCGLAWRPRPANDQWNCGVCGLFQGKQRTSGLLEM